jgi:hypothetical protein
MNSDMNNDNARIVAAEVRCLPPSMLDASLLAEYVKTGEAYDLSDLCRKSGVSIKQVAQIVVASSLDEVDKLPGYTMTNEIFELAENLYSIGESRRQWQLMRNRHKPSYLEGRLLRAELKRLELDPVKRKRHYANIYFRAWAIFWDDEFINRMIQKVDSRIIASLPEELITEQICLAAVSNSGLMLRYVPVLLRSPVVCTRAVQNDPAAIAFTPSHLRDQIRELQAINYD